MLTELMLLLSPGPTDVTAPGRMLHERFRALGAMTGKSLAEIIAVVGQPTSYSAMQRGAKLMQWQATGYHIAILFDASGRFLGVTHEYANYKVRYIGSSTLSPGRPLFGPFNSRRFLARLKPVLIFISVLIALIVVGLHLIK